MTVSLGGMIIGNKMYRPIPSNANTAVPINRGKLCLLKSATSAIPFLDRTEISLPPM